jgi:hypothetical protein
VDFTPAKYYQPQREREREREREGGRDAKRLHRGWRNITRQGISTLGVVYSFLVIAAFHAEKSRGTFTYSRYAIT